MTLQSSGAISFSEIQTEFGGSNPISISEYYRGGDNVLDHNTDIPESGAIALSDFYDGQNAAPSYTVTATSYTVTVGGGGAIGLQAGGESPASSNIDFITISTLGNGQKFGDLIVASFDGICCLGGTTRALFGGGAQPSGWSDRIMYVTFATKGNAADYGDLTTAMREPAPVNNTTRGIYCGGNTPSDLSNTINIKLKSCGVYNTV